MFKHIVALIVLSILVIILKTELSTAFQWVMGWHQQILIWLSAVFSHDEVGVIAQHSLALLAIPLIAMIVVALLLWIMRRKMLPFLPELMWIIWLLLVALVTVR